MPAPPKGKPAPAVPAARPDRASDRASDRTSAVVAAGVSVLAILGVATVFWGPLAALISPASAEAETSAAAGTAPGTAAGNDDGGERTSVGRADGGSHS